GAELRAHLADRHALSLRPLPRRLSADGQVRRPRPRGAAARGREGAGRQQRGEGGRPHRAHHRRADRQERRHQHHEDRQSRGAPQPMNRAELASRFVDVENLPWEKTRYPGVEQKTLLIDPATGLLTALMRMAPGARLPDHQHVKIEQTYVLEGTLVCPEGECHAGQFVWRPAGSRHEAWAGPKGGLFLAMFQVPNKFFQADGRITDFLGRDWQEAWGKNSGSGP